MSEPRVLIYDIENTPHLGWAWDKYDTTLLEVVKDSHLLCFAYKWLGKPGVHTSALPDFDIYEKEPDNDIGVASELWYLFDEADIVVAHNGNRFDQPKARAYFATHDFAPPSPFREVDTLKMARNKFRFTANNLDELCRQLHIGRKASTGGFDLWLGCMAGDPKAWAKMIRYNKQDVLLLEEVYLRLRPWVDNHPNLALISELPDACPKCGSEVGMMNRGYRYYGVTRTGVFQCGSCQAYSSIRLTDKYRPTYK